MTRQILAPTPSAAPAATGAVALAVLCDGAIRRFDAGHCGVFEPGGVLRVLDPNRRVVAEYATWTIVAR